MRTPPGWLRKGVGVAALLAVGLVIGTFYFYRQLTAPVDFRAFQRSNLWDLDEAVRKKKLFDEAKAVSQRGFVRVSEPEINAYLQEQESELWSETGLEGGGLELVRTRLALGEETATWYCWIRRQWLGKPVEFVWQRTAAVYWTNGAWKLELQAMRIGKFEVPSRFWERVQEELQPVDEKFEPFFHWVQQVPAFHISQNQTKQHKELRFYTYPVPEGLLENSP
jgi:hypothetical protein